MINFYMTDLKINSILNLKEFFILSACQTSFPGFGQPITANYIIPG